MNSLILEGRPYGLFAPHGKVCRVEAGKCTKRISYIACLAENSIRNALPRGAHCSAAEHARDYNWTAPAV